MNFHRASKSPSGDRKISAKVVLVGLICLVAAPAGGCRICADCEDGAYSAYGGIWQRTLRSEGRVGSVLEPAGALDQDLVDRDEPIGADDLERQRQQDRGGDSRGPDELEDWNRPRTPDDGTGPRPSPTTPDRNLDDIEESQREQELRGRTLEDIERELRQRQSESLDIDVIPGRPMPPSLQ